VLVDDEDRENEGDLTMAAEKITPEAVNFMARYGRGLVCLALTEERCDELALPLMTPVNTSNYGTAFCESIDARRARRQGSALPTARQLSSRRSTTRRAPPTWRVPAIFPAARAARWCARAGRPDRSVRGPGAHGGAHARGRDLRNHERGRHNGRVPQLAEFAARTA